MDVSGVISNSIGASGFTNCLSIMPSGTSKIALLGLGLLVIWELAWKGVALWKSAKNNQTWWFVFIMIINSIGVLPIIYLLFFKKKVSASAGAVSARKPLAKVRKPKRRKR
jgi:methionyl-tRNA synthetase